MFIISRFWPVLLPITIGIFVFVTEESLWKKTGLILLPTLIISIGFITKNIYLSVFCNFAPIILLIILLIYYRNRGVL